MSDVASELTFYVVEVQVADRSIWEHGEPQMVTRYALMDETLVIWVQGHPFGFLENMIKNDRSSSDCRYLLRKTPEDAQKDIKQWYTFKLSDDGSLYETVLL